MAYDLKLRELRLDRGFSTGAAFAEKVGIPPATYSNLEAERTRLTLETACTIADALGCSTDEIAGRETVRDLIRRPSSNTVPVEPSGDQLLDALIDTYNHLPKSLRRSAYGAVRGILEAEVDDDL